MNRRTFLQLAVLSAGIAERAFAVESAAKPQRIAAVVPQLREVSVERRRTLAANPENKPAAALNALVPEMDELEVDNGLCDTSSGNPLRIVAWNMERGRHWQEGVKLIQEHPALKNADVLLLSEMDLGITRSANAHTTRETAAALGMNYAYGVEFLELPREGDAGRTREMEDATFGFHGNAILSRRPLKNVRMLRFPGIERWYASDEHRLGGRNALFAEIEVAGRAVALVSTHLESAINANGERLAQVNWIVEELDAHSPGCAAIVGGDFNTVPGSGAIQALRAAGFRVDEANDLDTKTSQFVKNGKLILGFAHIDYIAVRGIEPAAGSPEVVPASLDIEGEPQLLSDHAIITVAVSL